MHVIFSELGILREVQEFFHDFLRIDDCGGVVFSYGDKCYEYFDADHNHIVPFTDQIWMAGSQSYHIAGHLFFCSSAIEAIAFLSFHYQTYKSITQFAFISFGLLPTASQFQFISQAIKRKKFSLVMGNDLLGRICDIKIAVGLQGHSLQAKLTDQGKISIVFRGQKYEFDRDKLTLNAFEKRTKFRSYGRTFKPKVGETFLANLIREAKENV